MRPDVPTLFHPHARLEPLVSAHRDGLREAAGTDSAAFAYMPADLSGPGFDTWFEQALSNQTDMIWTVIAPRTQTIVGSTRYLNMALSDKRVEIGYTWYARSAWGGAINPACKYLLCTYGFETLMLNRIELKTDARNARSRAAIAKLGARQEGIFRQHMIVQGGHIRDTVYFSVIAPEWPEVKARLLTRLAEAG
ncbi:MAG TPA: GNAT family N-acetyltransferase [Alphaproteobacteria bacterium]|nr:GNAT family N-acetyltransferase [Alphaproteobacteria bacterium]